eukprot:PhF_6_TR27157/c0_g2_i2/m.39708
MSSIIASVVARLIDVETELREHFTSILCGNSVGSRPSAKSLMECYNIVYHVLTNDTISNTKKMNGDHHAKIVDRMYTFFESFGPQLAEIMDGIEGDDLLAAFPLLRGKYDLFVRRCEAVYHYAEKHYIKGGPSIQTSLWTLYDTILKQRVLKLNHSPVFHGEIQKHRHGEPVQLDLVFRRVQLLEMVGVYKTEVLDPFVNITREYYAQTCTPLSGPECIPQWLKVAERICPQEVEIWERIIPSKDSQKVMTSFYSEYFRPSFEAILRDDVVGMKTSLDQGKWSNIVPMYRLAFVMQRLEHRLPPEAVIRSKPGVIDLMGDIMTSVIVEHGKNELRRLHDRLKGFELDKSYVEGCIALQNMYDVHTHLHCEVDRTPLSQAMSRGFIRVFNVSDPQGVEEGEPVDILPYHHLVEYIDLLMKQDASLGVDDEIKRIEECATLCSFVSDRDVLQEVCQTRLAKRLLLTSTVRLDSERDMLGKLKERLGPSFTHFSERMMADIEIGKPLLQAFRASPQYSDLPTDIDVHVLAAGFWPKFNIVQGITVPRSLRVCLDGYADFYKGYSPTHQARTLQWVLNMGGADMTARFRKGGVKSIRVNNFQAMMLLLVEEKPHSLTELSVALSLPVEKFHLDLASLCLNNTYALLKRNVQGCTE